jgi:hypothetical protein
MKPVALRLPKGHFSVGNKFKKEDSEENNEIKVIKIIGPKDVFRNNKYYWNAEIEINNSSNKFNFITLLNFKKINWGYSIDNSNTINFIKSTMITENNNVIGNNSILEWKVPLINCNSLKIYAWFEKNDLKKHVISNYLPLKDIYIKLLNYEVPANIKNNLKKVNGKIQNIIGNDTEQSEIFNMDYFSVRIDQMPFFVMNKEENADILYKKIRAAFLNLSKGNISFTSYANKIADKFNSTVNVEGSWEFKPYNINDEPNFSYQQLSLWNEEKGGTIFFIEAGGGFLEKYIVGDDGAVLESESNTKEKCWIFSTVVTKESGTQPFSGHRQFGIHKDEKGFYRFYARAIDRIWPSNILLISGNALEPLIDDYLTIANATWNNLIKNVSKFINDFGGKTTIMKPEIIVSEFKPFADVYKSKSTVKIVGNIKQYKKHE